MFYRENGQFKTSYSADQQIFPILQDRIAIGLLLVLAFVVVPLFGSEATLRIYHNGAMWLFIVFTFIHIYLVFYHDYVEGHGVLSSIIGGWKFMEKGKIAAQEATGISGLPTKLRKPADRTKV